MNSTPKTIIESLMDFSTPMSNITNTRLTDSNRMIVDKLLQKFYEHKTNFNRTQTYLNLLDNHIRELTNILQRLQNSLDQQSSLKPMTDQLEIRLLQMATKREQIRTHQSPSINQTLDDLIHQISPLKSKSTETINSYPELIHAMKLSLNQKTNLLDHVHHEENRFTNRISNIQLKQQRLLQLIEKLLEQEKTAEKSIQFTHLPKPQFERHSKQLNELNQLNEEYQLLQNENRRLKHNAKENIKTLYNFISNE